MDNSVMIAGDRGVRGLNGNEKKEQGGKRWDNCRRTAIIKKRSRSKTHLKNFLKKDSFDKYDPPGVIIIRHLLI